MIARTLLESPVERRHRPRDLSLLIEAREKGSLARQNPDLQGKADLSKVGVLGHSFGGYTAMAVAGATVDRPYAPDTRFKDPRIKTAIALPSLIMSSTKLEERGGLFDEMPGVARGSRRVA